jgi:hypothetical protein
MNVLWLFLGALLWFVLFFQWQIMNKKINKKFTKKTKKIEKTACKIQQNIRKFIPNIKWW